jgi:hypothetical protein
MEWLVGWRPEKKEGRLVTVGLLKTVHRQKVEVKNVEGQNVEWDKMPNDKMSNGKKC